PEGSVLVAHVFHADPAESASHPEVAALLWVLQISRSRSLPYEYFEGSPPSGSPEHASTHSSWVQSRLPSTSQSRAAQAGGTQTMGSSQVLLGNSKTSMQTLALSAGPFL